MAHRNPQMYLMICELLKALGCSIKLELRRGAPVIDNEKLDTILRSLSTVMDAGTEDVTRLVIKVCLGG